MRCAGGAERTGRSSGRNPLGVPCGTGSHVPHGTRDGRARPAQRAAGRDRAIEEGPAARAPTSSRSVRGAGVLEHDVPPRSSRRAAGRRGRPRPGAPGSAVRRASQGRARWEATGSWYLVERLRVSPRRRHAVRDGRAAGSALGRSSEGGVQRAAEPGLQAPRGRGRRYADPRSPHAGDADGRCREARARGDAGAPRAAARLPGA